MFIYISCRTSFYYQTISLCDCSVCAQDIAHRPIAAFQLCAVFRQHRSQTCKLFDWRRCANCEVTCHHIIFNVFKWALGVPPGPRCVSGRLPQQRGTHFQKHSHSNSTLWTPCTFDSTSLHDSSRPFNLPMLYLQYVDA